MNRMKVILSISCKKTKHIFAKELKFHQSSRNESNVPQIKKCGNCPVDDFRIFYGHGQGCPIGQIYFPIGEINFLDSGTKCSGNGEAICFARLRGKQRLVRLVP